MLQMFEHALLENQLVTAFAVVGIIVWVSNFLAHHLTGGRVHGSAIAVLAGLALAYWGGLLTGKTKGLGDLPLFSGMALMGGAMMRDFCIVATASEVHVDEAMKAWMASPGSPVLAKGSCHKAAPNSVAVIVDTSPPNGTR